MASQTLLKECEMGISEEMGFSHVPLYATGWWVSSLGCGGHKALVPQLMEALTKQRATLTSSSPAAE